MRKRIGLLLACLVVALGLAACQTDPTPTAANVNGDPISQANLNDVITSLASNPAYTCSELGASLDQNSGTGAVAGAGAGTYDAGFGAQVLSLLVAQKAMAQEVDRLHLPRTSLVTSLASSQLTGVFDPASGGSCPIGPSQAVADLSPGARQLLINLQGDEDVLAANLGGVQLTTTALSGYTRSHPGQSTLDCTLAIEVASSARATQVINEINAGAKFSTVARAASLDSASAAAGGSLGCISPSQLQTSLATIVAKLPVGTVSAPIAFGNDYVILEITSRPLARPDQIAQTIVLNEEQSLGTLRMAILRSAVVTVDPADGTWTSSAAGPGVLPLAGPPDALLSNAGAITPTPVSSAPISSTGG